MSENYSEFNGGGLKSGTGNDYSIGRRSELIISRSTVQGNSTGILSSDGGGVSSIGDLTIDSSTISGNSTRSSGGGGVFMLDFHGMCLRRV